MARFLRGARLVASVVCVAWAWLLKASPAGAVRMEGDVPWRIGGRVGFTVDAVAVPESTGLALEILVRIPPATIQQLSRDADGLARVRADFDVRGQGKATATQAFTLEPEDSVRGQGKVLAARFAARPGPCAIEVRLTDLNSRRRAANMPGGNANFSQVVTGKIDVPAPIEGRECSEIEFLWPLSRSPSTLSFVRAGRVAVPNPDRLYGLMAGEMRARFVVKGVPQHSDRPWHWVARVFDDRDQGVAQQESTAAASMWLDADVVFDVSNLTCGEYRLEVKAWQDGDERAMSRRAPFSVGWQPDTWLRDVAELTNESHFLLSASGEERFATMLPGAQEKLLMDYWSRRDPSPETARNEAYEVFRARVSHSNEFFTRIAAEPGMFSDMGRVYIRWGEPTEVLRQVMPAGNETLTQELQRIIDTETRMPTNVLQPGPGGDMRPFEVWIYEGNIPMPLDVDPQDPSRGRTNRRLTFLFVDDQGSGIYHLRYSTE